MYFYFLESIAKSSTFDYTGDTNRPSSAAGGHVTVDFQLCGCRTDVQRVVAVATVVDSFDFRTLVPRNNAAACTRQNVQDRLQRFRDNVSHIR